MIPDCNDCDWLVQHAQRILHIFGLHFQKIRLEDDQQTLSVDWSTLQVQKQVSNINYHSVRLLASF